MMLLRNIKNEILFDKSRFIIYTLIISLIIGILTGLNGLEKDTIYVGQVLKIPK